MNSHARGTIKTTQSLQVGSGGYHGHGARPILSREATQLRAGWIVVTHRHKMWHAVFPTMTWGCVAGQSFFPEDTWVCVCGSAEALDGWSGMS